ncbi:MAG: hypothetical protein ACK5TH_21495, partial [Prosthecobacter sp.]
RQSFWTAMKEKGYLLLLTFGVVCSFAVIIGVVGIAWLHHKLKRLEPQMNRLKNELEHATSIMKVTTDLMEDEISRIQSKVEKGNDAGVQQIG